MSNHRNMYNMMDLGRKDELIQELSNMIGKSEEDFRRFYQKLPTLSVKELSRVKDYLSGNIEYYGFSNEFNVYKKLLLMQTSRSGIHDHAGYAGRHQAVTIKSN